MHPSYYKRPLLIILIVYIAFLTLRKDAILKNSDNLSEFIPTEKANITAVIVEFPRKYENRTNIFVKVKSINGKPCRGKAIVYVDEPVDFKWRTKISVTGDLSGVKTAGIIGNLSWKEYLFAKGVQTAISATQVEVIQPPKYLAMLVNNLREHTLKVFFDNFSLQHAVVISGVTLGEKSSLSDELYIAFQNSGAMHLLVASGANVGFVTLIIYFLTSWLGLNRKRSAFIALIAAGIYTLCAGADPPLIRAYVMTIFATIGFVMQKESGIFQGLILSCLLILLFAPVSIFHVGFRMSFLATLGIVIAVSNYKFSPRLPKWVRFILVTFTVSAGAQIAIYPILALCFHKVSLVSVLANIILVPFSGVLMAAGFLVSAAAFVPFGKFVLLAVYPTKFLLWLFLFLVKFFAGFSFSAIRVPSFGWLVVFAYYLIAAIILYLPDKTMRKKLPIILGSPAILLLAINFLFFKSGKIYLFSTKYQRSVLVKTYDKTVFLIDAGINGEMLSRAIMSAGLLKIDGVFLTSLKYNSFMGIRELATFIDIKKVYLPYGEIKPKLERDIKFLKSKGIQFQRMWKGDDIKGKNWQAHVNWGLKQNRQGGFWRQEGYSGNIHKDSLSYRLILPEIEIETGANSYFINILKHGKITGDKFNIISKQGHTTVIDYTQSRLDVETI